MWRPARALSFAAARVWNKYVPRGKGAIPRILGQTLGRGMRSYISTAQGARLAVEPSCLDIYADICNHRGVWNEHVFTICAHLIEKGQVFWDIGANAGIISIDIAHAFEDKVHVFSFEPQPKLSHAIAVSAALNGFSNVNVFDVMIGEASGRTNLYIGSHAIHASARPRERHSSSVSRRVVTIDSLVESDQVMVPDLIKMDIEGGEMAALLGGKQYDELKAST